jgi:pyrroline-5-carboxylate reductase
MFRAVSSSIVRSSARLTTSRYAARPILNQASRAWLSTDGQGMYDKVAFIGAGKMAQAIIHPLIKSGQQPADKVTIFDVSTATMKGLKKEFPDIVTAQSITDAVADADMIVLAVKPQNVNEDFFKLFPPEKMREDATLVSILAGTPIDAFRPSGVKKIVRAMPNTPAQIGKGMTVWCCTPNLKTSDRDQVKKVLSTFGKAVSKQ